MISVVPKFRKQKSPAQSARHQKHKTYVQIPIALHIRDSTLHLLQCPSSLSPWAGKTTSATPPFSPPAAHSRIGEDTHRHCASIFLICCLTFPSDYSSFITYPEHKVKPFCKKEQVLRFFVDFCVKTGANGFSRDTCALFRRQCSTPLFFIHIFA